MATIRDIALAAGVNPSTVSKALRGSNDINPETAEKIKRIAAEMGYRMEQLHTSIPDTKTIRRYVSGARKSVLLRNF